MTARFYNHPTLGTADAAKRIADTLRLGLPDDEMIVPVSCWHMSRVAESAHEYAEALTKIEGKL